jgi:hypothetical protein
VLPKAECDQVYFLPSSRAVRALPLIAPHSLIPLSCPNPTSCGARKLTFAAARPLSSRARRPDGRSSLRRGEESPGSTETRCRVTPGGGDPRESATENIPPPRLRKVGRAARVKWCGKSAPRRRQRRRQGKPHREQDQVGVAGRKAGDVSVPPSGSVARGARQRASQRNGHRPSRDGDRTRLTGRLALFFRPHRTRPVKKKGRFHNL